MSVATSVARLRQARGVGLLLASSLFLAGVVSAMTALVPIDAGNVDWELGVIGELAATAALPLMGLVALLVVAMEAKSPRGLALVSVLAWTGSLLAVVGFGMMATNVPLVWSAFAVRPPREGLSVKIAVAKSLALAALYAVALAGFGWYAMRSFNVLRRK